MTKLLFIKASPRASSRSVGVAEAYLETLLTEHSGIEVDTIDVWRANLPEFDGDRANTKLTVFGGQPLDGGQRPLWDEISAIAGRFIAADHYLFAVPMWNGGIPYKLKQYIDLIHQPGLTFGFDPAKGYFGLLTGKRATLAYTSGAFAQSLPKPAFGEDFQSPYLRFWLAQAGVTDIEEIRYQPTILTADTEADFVAAKQTAANLAN